MNHRNASFLAALCLACAGAAAAEAHPEDAACRPPCEVHGAASKAAQPAPPSAQVASRPATRSAARPRGVTVAQTKRELPDDKRKPALAEQRVAR